METRANYALIGAFTIAVVAAAFGFVYWLSGTRTSQQRQELRVVFSGSVGGLAKGANVTFNGIRVGEVANIALLPQDPRRVVATVAVDAATPLRADTRARLDLALLTGVTSVALSGGEATSPALVAPPGDRMPTIFADASDIQDLVASARIIAQRADDLLQRLDRVVSENEGAITRTLSNAESFSKALADNAPKIDTFLSSVGQAAERIGPLSVKLESLATNADELIKAVDRNRVASIVESTESIAKTLSDNRSEAARILQETASLTKRLNDAAPKLDTALTSADLLFKSLDSVRINRILASTETFTTSLERSSPDVEQGLKSARSLAAKLDASADRVDAVLAGVQKFLGSATGEEGTSAFGEVKEAARAFRVMSENLDKRTGAIAAQFGKLSGSGRREVEALSTSGQRTLNDLSRTVRSLERNPSQVIFGGKPSLPEYSGR